MQNEYIAHFGVKGMKWGVRKKKDVINSSDRTIKRGTEIQNVSSKKLDMSKNNRLYSAYTSYDKNAYVDIMANFMYDRKGYKNTFLLKKDIKVPSDRKATEIFMDTVRQNPNQVAKDMAKAYNATHVISQRTEKYFKKKISELNSPDDRADQKLAKEFMTSSVMHKSAKTSANNFYANLVKRGYDAFSDSNDRDSFSQDPLVIVNLEVLGKPASMKLSKSDLDYYSEYTNEKEHTKQKKNLSEVQQ